MRCQRVSYRFTGVVTSDAPAWAESLAAALSARTPWRPASDVWETAEEFLVRLDVPGVADDDVQILVFADAVVVEGERRTPRMEHARFHVAEVRHGPFRLALRLPSDVDAASSEARMERGVLTVRLPKWAGGDRP